MARAAGKAGIPYSLSILGTKSIEEVSANSDGPKLLQIYVFKDRAITADLIERARSAGFDGLIVTVDTPLGGKRERDIVNGMSVPPKLSLSSFYLLPVVVSACVVAKREVPFRQPLTSGCGIARARFEHRRIRQQTV